MDARAAEQRNSGQQSPASAAWEVGNGHSFLRLPLYRDRFELTAKLEGFNPAGSIKLKTAIGLVDDAERRLGMTHGLHLIESTSGNLGIALATVCASRGHSLTLVTDPNATEMAVRHMRALGAIVLIVEERDQQGGYLDTRIRFVQQLVDQDDRLHWLNQYGNSANSRAHAERTVSEILEWYGIPDLLFIGAGTTGTLMGCVEGFREANVRPRIVAVDAEGSITFGDTEPIRRRIPGIGTSRRPELFQDDGSFEKIRVAEVDAIRACRLLARESGLLVGGSTGSVIAAVAALSKTIPRDSRVLIIAPDQGEKYLDTIYDDDWVAAHFGTELVK